MRILSAFWLYLYLLVLLELKQTVQSEIYVIVIEEQRLSIKLEDSGIYNCLNDSIQVVSIVSSNSSQEGNSI